MDSDAPIVTTYRESLEQKLQQAISDSAKLEEKIDELQNEAGQDVYLLSSDEEEDEEDYSSIPTTPTIPRGLPLHLST